MPDNCTIDINILDMQQMKNIFQAVSDLLQNKDKEIQNLKETIERKENEIKIKDKTIVDLLRRVDILEHNIKENNTLYKERCGYHDEKRKRCLLPSEHNSECEFDQH